MKSKPNRVARSVCGAAVLAFATLLASCGGGGNQNNNFYPQRVISFGDELSVINADGSKYSVNALVPGSSSQLDCNANPLWIQVVAARYGMVFPQCAGQISDPPSRIYAGVGAVVADLPGQIDQQLNNGGFNDGDLVTVLVGANDVVAQFAQYPAVGEDQLKANLQIAAQALAGQVNRMAGLGARVLIATIPDMGLTPFAGDRSTGSTDGNPAVLGRLSDAFNDALLASLTNDGHFIGLVQLDQYLKSVDAQTRRGQGTFRNSTEAACAVPLPNCTTATLTADAVNSVFLWADGRHLSAQGQSELGSIARSRAESNPF